MATDSRTKFKLQKDAEICSLLQEFSINIQKKVSRLSYSLEVLEQRQSSADSNASKILLDSERMKASNAMWFDITDNDGTSAELKATKRNSEGKGRDTDAAALQKEEYDAIRDGISALKYYHHQSKTDNEFGSDHYFNLDEEDAGSPQYYESAESDLFNQRPLPYIIGSKAFMESKDGGIGGEDERI